MNCNLLWRKLLVLLVTMIAKRPAQVEPAADTSVRSNDASGSLYPVELDGILWLVVDAEIHGHAVAAENATRVARVGDVHLVVADERHDCRATRRLAWGG